MNGVNDQQSMLTVREAATMLRIGRNLAYELVARGEIPSVRLGRLIRVPRAALEERLGTAGLAGR
jgi:excisionase family DNA binding protein